MKCTDTCMCALHRHRFALCDVCAAAVADAVVTAAAAVQTFALYISISKSNNVHHLMLRIVCLLALVLSCGFHVARSLTRSPLSSVLVFSRLQLPFVQRIFKI